MAGLNPIDALESVIEEFQRLVALAVVNCSVLEVSTGEPFS